MQPAVNDYDALFGLIETRVGVNLTNHQREDIVMTVESLLTSKTGLTFRSLYSTLLYERTDNPLWQRLINVVTVGETYFHRNMFQVNALRDVVFPALIRERRANNCKVLRIWSAGCASGEEPYSVAMILRDLLPDIDDWSILILGTDVNLTSLERARAGIYRSWSFRGETPPEVQSRWFTKQDDLYRVRPVIQHMVTFAPLNLLSNDFSALERAAVSMDVILCRNVLIYFSADTISQLVGRFKDTLVENGWLILGHAESVPPVHRDAFTVYNLEGTVIFQKTMPVTQTTDYSWSRPAPTTETPMADPKPAAATASTIGSTSAAAPISMDDESEIAVNFLQEAQNAADYQRWDEALTHLARAEQQDNLHPHIHYLRALVHLENGSPDDALSSLRQAIYCDPAFALAHYTLAELYRKHNQPLDSARHLRSAMTAIANLPENTQLDKDMTVYMLRDLIRFRLSSLEKSEPSKA
jgi:chemotaxis protein methyltransferase CheR